MKATFVVVQKTQYEKSCGIRLEQIEHGHSVQSISFILPKETWLRARIGDEVMLDLSFPHPE